MEHPPVDLFIKPKTMNHLSRYHKFLLSVDLDKFRSMYQSIKIVEMDLPKEIQTLDNIYRISWEEKNFILLEEF